VDVTRRLVDPGPYSFDQLQMPHAVDSDVDVARKMMDKFFPGVELSFALFEVPLTELVESSLVEAVSRKTLAPEVYLDWRSRGASHEEARTHFAASDAHQRRDPAFADELKRIEALEDLFAKEAAMDPLIARSLEVPLSTGEDALFIIDARHRLLAAAATGIEALHVYIGKPTE
jgi:hypothetical protein